MPTEKERERRQVEEGMREKEAGGRVRRTIERMRRRKGTKRERERRQRRLKGKVQTLERGVPEGRRKAICRMINGRRRI